MGLRVAYVSDQRFFRCRGRWYTTASFPLDLAVERLDVAAWTFWGRLGEVTDASRLFPLDPPPALAGRMSFEGPAGQGAGPAGWARAAVGAAPALARVVRRADVVWLKQPTVSALLALPWRRRSQVVVSQQVGDAAEGLALAYPRWRLLGGVVARSCRRTAAAADVASFVSRSLAERYGGGRADAVVASESRVPAAWVREAPPDLPDRPLEVVFAGRLAAEKRVEDLLRAVADVPEARLTVVGDGPRRGALEAEARALGVEARVGWLGAVAWGPALLDVLRRSSVLVLPSATEGLPLVLVEAMSQGTPVVATRVGGVPELVEDGVTGLLVPPGRPDELARALRALLEDPPLRRRLARAALDGARRHTLEAQLGKLLARVGEACAARRSPALGAAP
jgi:glycosyltransferase involved in cell wall biosynthesis